MPLAYNSSRRSQKFRAAPRGRPHPTRMRKVSKRGAYRKGQKRNFINKRAAVVETKRKTYEDMSGGLPGFWNDPAAAAIVFPVKNDYTVRNAVVSHLNPLTYYFWSQGLNQAQHIGQCITVKNVNMKIQFRFPQPSMLINMGGTMTPQVIPQTPMFYKLYWGWVPAPLQFTGSTTPTAPETTAALIESHVNNRVKDFFDERQDRLRFIPKKDSSIRIIGSKKISPDLRFQSTAPAQTSEGLVSTTVSGTIPDRFAEIKWDIPAGGRKVWLEQSVNLDGASKLAGFYPNYSWLPFCCLVSYYQDELPATNRELSSISTSHNDITYFTDS